MIVLNFFIFFNYNTIGLQLRYLLILSWVEQSFCLYLCIFLHFSMCYILICLCVNLILCDILRFPVFFIFCVDVSQCLYYLCDCCATSFEFVSFLVDLLCFVFNVNFVSINRVISYILPALSRYINEFELLMHFV